MRLLEVRAVLGLPTPQALKAMGARAVTERMSVRGLEEAMHLEHRRSGATPSRRPRALSGP